MENEYFFVPWIQVAWCLCTNKLVKRSFKISPATSFLESEPRLHDHLVRFRRASSDIDCIGIGINPFKYPLPGRRTRRHARITTYPPPQVGPSAGDCLNLATESYCNCRVSAKVVGLRRSSMYKFGAARRCIVAVCVAYAPNVS